MYKMHICKSNKDKREEGIFEGETTNAPLSQLLTTSISDNSCCIGEHSILLRQRVTRLQPETHCYLSR